MNNVNVDYIRLEAKKLLTNVELRIIIRDQSLDFSREEGIDIALSKLKEKLPISFEFEQILKSGMGKPYQIPIYKPMQLGQQSEIDHYETRFTNFLQVAEEIDKLPPSYFNGLITSGNCDNFSPFVEGVMEDLGIANYSVSGKGEIEHQWTMYKDEESGEWKHCDMTYLLYARDGRKMAGECDPLEWAQADTPRMFKLQPTREIKEINNNILPVSITRENQSLLMEEFVEAIDDRSK